MELPDDFHSTLFFMRISLLLYSTIHTKSINSLLIRLILSIIIENKIDSAALHKATSRYNNIIKQYNAKYINNSVLATLFIL